MTASQIRVIDLTLLRRIATNGRQQNIRNKSYSQINLRSGVLFSGREGSFPPRKTKGRLIAGYSNMTARLIEIRVLYLLVFLLCLLLCLCVSFFSSASLYTIQYNLLINSPTGVFQNQFTCNNGRRNKMYLVTIKHHCREIQQLHIINNSICKIRNNVSALRISPLALLLNCASEDEFLVATESLFQDFRAL